MHKIVWLERDTFPQSVQVRRPAAPHEWVEWPATRPEQVAERLAGATVALVNKVAVRRAAIERLPDLKLIAVSATGTDCVDLDACRERGILVTNVTGYSGAAVPEHTFALILAAMRNIPDYAAAAGDGRWSSSPFFCVFGGPIRDLHGLRLAIVGRGAIGSAVGRIGTAFGMDVVYAGRKSDPAPSPGYLPFGEALETADVLSLHCPLNAETQKLIGAAEFARMTRRPLLVNTSRGGLIDESALADALDRGLIRGAALDTISVEPPPPGHPMEALARRPNMVVTPHVAWASEAAMQRLLDIALTHVGNFLDGRPTGLVVGPF